MSGMERRQALRVFAGAAVAAPSASRTTNPYSALLGARLLPDGYAPGHATFAWKSQDGRSVQLSQAENLTWHAGPHDGPGNAIDKARAAFEEAACD